ncbi:hypothetical protein HDU98_004112, partial [Podochytrium sp. JEL0797]
MAEMKDIDVLVQITNHLEALQQQVGDFSKELRDVKSELSLVKSAIMTLEQREEWGLHPPPEQSRPSIVDRLGPPVNQSSSSSSESLQLAKSFGKIEKFTGASRDLTKNFVISIRLRLTSLPNVSIAQKITFVASHLNKTALDWFSNTVLIPDRKFATFEDFISLFSATFGVDEVITEESACEELRALKQTGSCSAYATKFLRLISYTRHNDYTQVDMFKAGLKPHILAHLSHSKQIMDLTKLIRECMLYDDREFAIRKRTATASPY